jgi:hypothetical protein
MGQYPFFSGETVNVFSTHYCSPVLGELSEGLRGLKHKKAFEYYFKGFPNI